MSHAKPELSWCAPDSIAQAQLIKSCSKESTWTRLIRPDPRTADVVMLNIGANKGYEIAEFFQRHAPHRGITNRIWYSEIVNYANLTHSKHLRWSAPGGCKDYRNSKPSWATDLPSGQRLRVHAFELNQRTSALLTHLASAFNLSDMVTVHRQPVSDVSGPVCVNQGPAGYEKGGIRTVAAARCSEYLNATSIDSFLRRTPFSHVFQLVVDTEGHDAAVLMGMRQSLRERRIRILQFEYSGRWPVEPKECKLRSLDAHYPVACKKPSRTLGSTVRWMWEEAGYACYFTGAQDGAMIPISNACWRPELEVRRWSDVLCAHQQGDIDVLSELSASAFARRGERGGPRAQLQNNTRWTAETSAPRY
jgi:FkbM family methyltransferase